MGEEVKKLSLNFNAKVIPIKNLNEQFTYCKCYAHALGKNRNLSYFSKDNVIRNADSINYIPVVGHLIQKEDGTFYMGSHDIEFLVTNEGLTIKQLTVPYGVVVNDTMGFEDVIESDGTTVTYVTVDVILWTGRYPELLEAIYSENIYFNESMEVNYTKFKPLDEDKNYTEIIDWTYSALCMLGKADDTNSVEHTEPCFPSSRIEPYSNNFNQSEFSKVMSELKDELATCFNVNDDKKGGKMLKQELIDEILKEFNLKNEDVNFEISEDVTEEQLRTKFEEIVASKTTPTSTELDATPSEPRLFSATYRQKRDAINNALAGSVAYDENGNIIDEVSYWVSDFDDTYVYVEKDHWTTEGFDEFHGRFTYTFDETNLVATITSEFEEMFLVWLTADENQKLQDERSAFELVKKEYEEYKEKYSIPNEEVDALKKFKEDTLFEARSNEEKELFDNFESDLSAMEEYTSLKEKAKDYSIEELSEKLFALLGKKNAMFSASSKNSNTKIPVGAFADNSEEDPYGGLLTKYYNK